MIQVDRLTKTYGSRRVLDNLTLTVPSGAVVAVLGPNGAGKTTLVRILTTLLRPDAGTATIAGHDVIREPDTIRSLISLTGQYAAVDELLTGEENLRLMTRLWRLDRATSRRRIRELLEQFELVEASSRPVRTYSGGMRRKLDLALSLLPEPRVLFLDEPTTGLDPRSRIAMWDVVRQLAASGLTVLLTTQYLEEADQLADAIALIDGGRLIAEGTPAQLKRRISGEIVEIGFADEPTLQRAATLLGPRATPHLSTPCTLTAGIDGPGDIRDLLNALEHAGVRPERLAVTEPTLDDVFLSLTGQPTPAQKAA
jgi:ABC-2 type transport system ATP-binding protein